jgi:ABC-type transport system involved in cytochrome c biogenesis ATPase subunit
MLTEVMRSIDAGFYETDHHAQVSRDVRAAILGGCLVALTAIIGSGKTILSRRLRAELEREGRVIASASMNYRAEQHSRTDDWLGHLPAKGVRQMCAWERFCMFAREPERLTSASTAE